jgi:hypothetical protein
LEPASLIQEGVATPQKNFFANDLSVSGLCGLLPFSPPPPRCHCKSSFARTRGAPHPKSESTEATDDTQLGLGEERKVLVVSQTHTHLTNAVNYPPSHLTEEPAPAASSVAFNTLSTPSQQNATPRLAEIFKETVVHRRRNEFFVKVEPKSWNH